MITPSLTWVSTANVITLLGATPVFVDVDRDTLMCSAQAVEAAIGPRTRAIVPVHYAGSTLDLEACARSPGATASPWSRTPPTRSAANTAGAR